MKPYIFTPGDPKPAGLCIVVPVLNEAQGIEATLRALAPARQRGARVVVVDGGSQDDTLALARAHADAVIGSARGRAAQMNAGAALGWGQVLLFLHADTTLPERADEHLMQALARGHAWGRFDVRIAGRPWMLRVVAAMMNLRSRWTGIATGDQALFMRREAYAQVGGFAPQPLMEDIDMSKRLRPVGAPACLRERVITSGRRWEQRGVWRTIFLMWRLRWRYWRGESAHSLAEDYR
jgi:rSAM/selenodomain-associated transferase 2